MVLPLFSEFGPAGLRYIFIFIGAMPAAIAAAIAFIEMVLFGENDQPILAPVIMQPLSEIFHR